MIINTNTTYEQKLLLLEIQNRAPQAIISEVKTGFTVSTAPPLDKYSKLTKAKIVDLNRKMKKKVNELQRAETKRTLTLNQALKLEDLSESAAPSEWREKLTYSPPRAAPCEPVSSTAGIDIDF